MNMKKTLQFLILIMAIGMATTVAYVSVSGLVKLFAGAGVVGLIFFSSIEAGKIIATSAIHSFNKKIGWVYNTILSFFIIIAMGITSLGIYGFLSSSYKETFAKLDGMNSQVSLLETKKEGYQKQIELINKDRESVRGQISDLSDKLSIKSQYTNKDGEVVTYIDRRNTKVIQNQLTEVRNRESVLNVKSDSLSDLVFSIESQITEVKLGNDVATELGPLKYLADVTGMSMDEVMKYFIILLMVIGDPMAVVMVIVYNKISHKTNEEEETKEKKDKTNYGEIVKGLKGHLPKDLLSKLPFGQKEPVKLSEEKEEEEPIEETRPEFSWVGVSPEDKKEKPGRPVNEITKDLLNEVREENGEIELPEEPIEVKEEVHLPTPTEEAINKLDETIEKAQETQEKLFTNPPVDDNRRRVLKDDGQKRTLHYKKRKPSKSGITRI